MGFDVEEIMRLAEAVPDITDIIAQWKEEHKNDPIRYDDYSYLFFHNF